MVSAMWTAAQEGRASEYLGFFCDPMRARLENDFASMGEPAFADYLRRRYAGLKGTACREARPINGPSDLAERLSLPVTLIFEDRYEEQVLTCRNTDAGWRIAEVSLARRTQPPIPYGTPVYVPVENAAEQGRE